MTGQFYLDLASVLVKMDRRQEAISFLEKAFEIFEILSYSDQLEKAALASQIAVVLLDFGNQREAIEFAHKSNEIYLKKNDAALISKILDNKLVEAQALMKLGETNLAVTQAENIFTQISNNSVWTTSLGKYVAESLKVVYEMEMNKLSYEERCKIYYVCDMLHNSFKNDLPLNETFILDRLKKACEECSGLVRFVKSIAEGILSNQSVFQLNNIVAITYDEFMEQYEGSHLALILEKVKIMYISLGSRFLLHTLRPVIS